MADKLKITRRDFLNGMALSLAAGTSLSPMEILAMEGRAGTPGSYYPPSLTGLRGSHAGSYEISHAVAMAGARFGRPEEQMEMTYDLIVVGGGISGLSAAYMYQQRAGADKRILVIDNHDDFGGHAKRNEFTVDGEHLIGYGGSMTIDQPHQYSPQAKQLLRDISIDTDRFYDYFDQEYFSRRGFQPNIYFSSDHYGRDATLPNVFGGYFGNFDRSQLDNVLDRYPLDNESKQAILRLITEDRDYLDGMTVDEKVQLMYSISFADYLRDCVGMPEPVILMLRDFYKGISVGAWDSAPAMIAVEYWHHGTRSLGLEKFVWGGEEDEPFIHHFPDGNAGVARLLVRQLIPDALPGHTMEDSVREKVDYDLLDRPENGCRIRLNSTAVDVRHTADENHVEVTYVLNGQPQRVVASNVILACYNSIVPHICPEVPAAQAEAIGNAVKVPLIYPNIAVRNWRAWDNLKTSFILQPQTPYMHNFTMDFPVSIGGYEYTQDPDTPTVLHGSVVMVDPGSGLGVKDQCRVGAQRLYEMSFDEHEELIIAQLDGALSPGGFDVERDIAAITVNRWPHGYAWEYIDTTEYGRFSRNEGPHVAGRAQIGRISIANSDSEAYAYVDGAIDAAHRAVTEQLAT